MTDYSDLRGTPYGNYCFGFRSLSANFGCKLIGLLFMKNVLCLFGSEREGEGHENCKTQLNSRIVC